MFLITSISLLAAALAFLGVGRFRRWAEERRILDVPNQRSSHSRPTPRGGGLVIAAVALFCIWLLPLAAGGFAGGAMLLPYTIGALVIAIVSWLDDLGSFPRWARLSIHVAAAILAVAGLGYWRAVDLPILGRVHLGWTGAPLAILWIVGLTNAYNFMDGIDGIAAGQAVVAGLGWGVLGWVGGQPLLSGAGMVTAGSSLGFLVHNWHPARIFMGDVGSAFLGYTFAVLPLAYHSLCPGSCGGTFLVGIALVWPFVFDTTFTFMRRLRKRENVLTAHRSHLYQRLVVAGWSHGSVSLLYIGLACAGVALVRVWSQAVVREGTAAVLALPLLFLVLWVVVAALERKAFQIRSQLSTLADPS